MKLFSINNTFSLLSATFLLTSFLTTISMTTLQASAEEEVYLNGTYRLTTPRSFFAGTQLLFSVTGEGGGGRNEIRTHHSKYSHETRNNWEIIPSDSGYYVFRDVNGHFLEGGWESHRKKPDYVVFARDGLADNCYWTISKRGDGQYVLTNTSSHQMLFRVGGEPYGKSGDYRVRSHPFVEHRNGWVLTSLGNTLIPNFDFLFSANSMTVLDDLESLLLSARTAQIKHGEKSCVNDTADQQIFNIEETHTVPRKFELQFSVASWMESNTIDALLDAKFPANLCKILGLSEDTMVLQAFSNDGTTISLSYQAPDLTITQSAAFSVPPESEGFYNFKWSEYRLDILVVLAGAWIGVERRYVGGSLKKDQAAPVSATRIVLKSRGVSLDHFGDVYAGGLHFETTAILRIWGANDAQVQLETEE